MTWQILRFTKELHRVGMKLVQTQACLTMGGGILVSFNARAKNQHFPPIRPQFP